MRRLYLLVVTLAGCVGLHSQSAVPKITSAYYRSDPFQNEFNVFLNHLIGDPTISEKVIQKRTDSTLFYFQGTYSSHNPFFFKPAKVQVILTELPVQLDSLTTDTIYAYQLFAYINNSEAGVREVKKEFAKIYKRYKGSFPKISLVENVQGSLPGMTYNFFDLFHAIAPFALTWAGPDENGQMYLILTIRMQTNNNRAILPVPFYAP
jgi:hypothetical protein